MRPKLSISILSAYLLSGCVPGLGCGSLPPGGGSVECQRKTAPSEHCLFYQTQQRAPGWICEVPQPDLEILAVGIADPTKADESFRKNLAEINAHGRLVERFKIKVRKIVSSYLEGKVGSDAVAVNAVVEATLKAINSESIIGAEIYQSITGPNNRIYVLVGLDDAAYEKSIRSAVLTSMNNNSALWKRFQMNRTYEEMAADLVKNQTKEHQRDE